MRYQNFIKKIATIALGLGILIFNSCGTTETTSQVIGNWIRHTQYQFQGTPRSGAASFVINDKAYLGLGYNGKIYPIDFFELDISSGTWRRLADFPALGRERSVSFEAGGKGYVGLGYNRDDVGGLKNGAKDFYEYDPSSNTWTKKADFPGSARYDAIGFGLNNNGYAGTGYDEQGYYNNDFYQYTPATDTWTAIANFGGGKRNRAFAMVLNGKAYVAGGFNNNSFLSDFWSFDGTNWTSLNPSFDASYYTKFTSAVNRIDANMFSINEKIFIVNGIGSGNSLMRTCFEYDIASGEWTEKTTFERSSRFSSVSFTLANGTRGFVCAGQSSSSVFLDDIEELKSNDEYEVND